MRTRRPFARLLPALGLAVGFILACGGGDEESPEEAPTEVVEEPAAEPAPEPAPEPEPEQKKSVAIEHKKVVHTFTFELAVPVAFKHDQRVAKANENAAKEVKKRGWDEVGKVSLVRKAKECGKNICKHDVHVEAIELKPQFAE